MYGLGRNRRYLVHQRGTVDLYGVGPRPNNRNAIATAELNFAQISDSHIGFNKPANMDVVGTFRETIMRVNALPKVPEFLFTLVI